MVNFKHLLFSASSAMAIAMLVGAPIQEARAADVVQVCQPLAGTVTAGYIFGDLNIEASSSDDDDDDDDIEEDFDFGTFFGEGEVLYHICDTNLNVQGDYAFHSHQFDIDESFDATDDRWHVGGILFWRDQDVGVLGLDVSFLNDDISGINSESWRVGLRGEYFAGDMFTVGTGAGFFEGNFFGKNSDGFDVNAWARIYPTENIGLLARFDYAEMDVENLSLGSDLNTDSWAIGGEGEYLLPSVPVSIFAGARYGETDGDIGNSIEFSTQVTEIYAGLSVYFGSDGNGGSLASHHRNNTLDNTSVIFERMPSFILGGPS